jgi:4-amino-4-deoxy-L-arabinose transferase-like glycosyltransferase
MRWKIPVHTNPEPHPFGRLLVLVGTAGFSTWKQALKGRAMRKTLLYFGLLIVATVAFRSPLLNIPLERDEGEYAYIAWRLDYHELPYRDWIDQKPPVVFWLYRLALTFPFPDVASIHLLALLISALTASVLFLTLRRFTSEPWALAGAGLFALLAADPHVQGSSANTELFMLLPLVLAQWAFLYCGSENRRRYLWMFGCGLFVGLATACKQVAGLTWPLLVLLYPVFHERRKPGRSSAMFLLLSGLGAGVVWLGIAGYFKANHAFEDFVYGVFKHNLEYIQAVPWADQMRLLWNAVKLLAPTQAIAWVFAVLGIVGTYRQKRWMQFIFLLEWLLASAGGVSASGRFFPHYFQQLLPVLCVSATIGARMMAESARWKRIEVRFQYALFALAWFVIPIFFILPYWIATPEAAVDMIFPSNYFGEMQVIGRRLADTTKPGDKVFVFGADPEVLFYGRRASATRYIFLFPLYGPYSDAKQNQITTVEGLKNSPPAAILYLPNRLFFLKGTEQLLTQWTQSELLTNYTGDLWLASGADGSGHLYHGEGVKPPPEAAGKRVLGGLFLRRENRGGVNSAK